MVRLLPCHRRRPKLIEVRHASSKILGLNERVAARTTYLPLKSLCWTTSSLRQHLLHSSNLLKRCCKDFDLCSGDSTVWTVTNEKCFVAKQALNQLTTTGNCIGMLALVLSVLLRKRVARQLGKRVSFIAWPLERVWAIRGWKALRTSRERPFVT